MQQRAYALGRWLKEVEGDVEAQRGVLGSTYCPRDPTREDAGDKLTAIKSFSGPYAFNDMTFSPRLVLSVQRQNITAYCLPEARVVRIRPQEPKIDTWYAMLPIKQTGLALRGAAAPLLLAVAQNSEYAPDCELAKRTNMRIHAFGVSANSENEAQKFELGGRQLYLRRSQAPPGPRTQAVSVKAAGGFPGLQGIGIIFPSPCFVIL